MEPNHKLGLIVSYYLSRFDTEAYHELGFTTRSEAHKSIGATLGIKPSTVENWRDEFDPIHGFRAGWHQRSLRASRAQVVLALQDLSLKELGSIVHDILDGGLYSDPLESTTILNIFNEETESQQASIFTPRGPTGKKAEEFFIRYFEQNARPLRGSLVDLREYGVGYDFEIVATDKTVYIEVKGMLGSKGGVQFTGKEWVVASERGEDYYLAIVSDIESQPRIEFIGDPANRLQPTKKVFTSVQLSWNISAEQLTQGIHNEQHNTTGSKHT